MSRTGLILVVAALGLYAQAPPPWCQGRPGPEWQALRRVPVSQAWFSVHEVAPSVYAIWEPRQSEGTISYLIVGTRRALLFDTGMGIGDMRAVTAELTPLPVVVANSHTHHDHVGGNWQSPTVRGRNTPFTRRNAQGSREDAQAEIAPGEICGELPTGFDNANYQTRPWKITAKVRDGQIELGGRTVQVLATPGHTPDAICLFDAASGMLFTGDTFYQGTVWLFRPETDLRAYGESLRRLAALAPRVRTLHGAHGVPTVPGTVLPRLQAAFASVQEGKVAATALSNGRVRFRVDGFSFLLRDPAAKP